MEGKSCALLAFSFLVAAAVPAVAQDSAALLDNGRRDLLHEALSGEVAKDHVIQITRHHRIQGSRGYRDAAEYVLAQLREYGFSEEEAWIESFPSDGRLVYQTWQSPSGWDIDRAELRIVEPVDERLVGYPEIGMSVITYSNPGDLTAELVWVGPGTSDADYEGKDVSGKFVLATGYGGEVHRHAVLKHGAESPVDKDLATTLLAVAIGADQLLLVTGVDGVYTDFGKPCAQRLTHTHPDQLQALLEAGHFPPGSMGPKVEAAIRFVRATGGRAAICQPGDLAEAMTGRAGTLVEPLRYV